MTTPARQDVINYLQDLCVSLGLVFVNQEPTVELAGAFHVYFGSTCLISANDPMQVEFYLYGFRDARKLPVRGAAASLIDSMQVLSSLDDAVKAIETAKEHGRNVRKFVYPLAGDHD